MDYFLTVLLFSQDGKLCRWQLQLDPEAVCRHTVQGKVLFLLTKALLITFTSIMESNPICFVQHSLAVLMEKMFAASPHFVRCIKPNSSKLPDQVDSKLIMDQVSHFIRLFVFRVNAVIQFNAVSCNISNSSRPYGHYLFFPGDLHMHSILNRPAIYGQ